MVTTVSDISDVIVNANIFTPRRWKGNPMSADSLLHSVGELFALLQTRRAAYVLVGGITLLLLDDGDLHRFQGASDNFFFVDV